MLPAAAKLHSYRVVHNAPHAFQPRIRERALPKPHGDQKQKNTNK
jgi:hypothetical protein